MVDNKRGQITIFVIIGIIIVIGLIIFFLTIGSNQTRDDEGDNSINSVEKDEIKRVIIQAITELPEKEKKVLGLYYYEDLTLKEIGKILEVTESRISQLHTKAIMRLRSKLTNIKKGIF